MHVPSYFVYLEKQQPLASTTTTVCTVVSKKTLVYDVCQSRQPKTESGNAQWYL